MPASGSGNATPKKRKGRAVLSLREPLVEKLLVGLTFEGEDLDRIRRVCKKLVRERNQWDIGRRGSGIFGLKRLSKSDADGALKCALNALEAYK